MSESREIASIQVMNVLQKRLEHYTDLSVWISGNYDPAQWKPIFDKMQGEINAIREWANNLPRGDVRNEYLSWLDYYYERGLLAARRELVTQEKKRHHEMADREQDNRYHAVSESGPIAEPPSLTAWPPKGMSK